MRCLYPQHAVQMLAARRQLRRRDLFDDLAVIHDEMAVGQRRGKTEVLLDQYDGHAPLFQLHQHFAQLLHDDRGQAFGNFIEQQQPRTGAQNARHGQHLLFTARESGS